MNLKQKGEKTVEYKRMADSLDPVNVLVIETLAKLLPILKYRNISATTKNDYVALYAGAL